MDAQLYQQFIAWYKSIYGEGSPTPPNDANIQNVKAVQLWVSMGQPVTTQAPEGKTVDFQGVQFQRADMTAPSVISAGAGTLPRPATQLAGQTAGVPMSQAQIESSRYAPTAPPSTPASEEATGEPERFVDDDGYIWIGTRDLEGNFMGWEFTGQQVPKQGIDLFQQEQVARWGRLDEQAARESQWQMQQASQQDTLAQERQQRESTWREASLQQQLELERGGPVNWIKQWYLQNEPNPYKVPTESRTERLGETQKQLGETKSWLDQTSKAILEAAAESDAIWTAIKSQQGSFNNLDEYAKLSEVAMKAQKSVENRVVNLQKRHETLLKLEKQQIEAEQIGKQWTSELGGGDIIGKEPTSPSTPSWMSQYVPGLKAGQPITKQATPTPSGQQLTRMPWSQQQMLQGYWQWAGQNPQDVLGQVPKMQTPRTPYQWAPARQMA